MDELLSNLVTLREIIDDFKIHMDSAPTTINKSEVVSTLNEMDRLLVQASDGLADVIL